MNQQEQQTIDQLQARVTELEAELARAKQLAAVDTQESFSSQILQASPATIVITDAKGTIIYENPAIRELFRYRHGDSAVGRNLITEENAIESGVSNQLSLVLNGELEYATLDERPYRSFVTGYTPIIDVHIAAHKRNETVLGAIIHFTDVTKQCITRQLSDEIVNNSPIGILVLDDQGMILSHNRALGISLGDPTIEVIGHNLLELKSVQSFRDTIESALAGEFVYDYRVHYRSVFTDQEVHLSLWMVPIYRGNEVEQVVIMQHDISAQVAIEQKLAKFADTDELTGLPNRRGIKSSLDRAGQDKINSNEPYSVIMCDIDKFKSINDHMGHDCGDMVIKTIGAILADSVRAEDEVSRWGGEEFLILMRDKTLETARAIAERLRISIDDRLFKYNNKEFQVSMSFGVFEPKGNMPISEAIRHADELLYRAKREGRNRVISG